jgi:hypothetical protein
MTTTKTMKFVVIEQNNAQQILANVEWSSTQKKQQRWNITALQ